MAEEIPKTLTPEYIDRCRELVSAIALKLQDEFGVETSTNLLCIASTARAIFRKDM